MKWDSMDAIFQWHKYISECFHQDILPLWSPYSRLGYPFFGDPQNGFYYPITWLFTSLFNYNVYTANAELVIHSVIASIGMFHLLKKLQYSEIGAITFGIIYSLCGVFISHAMHFTLFVSAAYTPWFFLTQINLARKNNIKAAIQASFVAGLMLCGGYIPLSIINGYLALGFHGYHFLNCSNKASYVKSLLGFGVGLFALSFTCFGMFLSIFPYIDRSSGVSLESANANAFTLKSYISFILPLVSTSSSIDFQTDISMRNTYFGFLMLPFMLLYLFKSAKKQERWLFIIGIIFLIISLGNLTPLRTWLYQFVPLMNMFRFASIFRFTAVFLFIIVSCGTFDWLIKNWSNQPAAIKTIATIYLCLMLSIIAAALISNNELTLAPMINPSKWESFYESGIWNLAFNQSLIHAILLSLFIAMLFTKKLHAKYLSMLLIIDICAASLLNQFSTSCMNKKNGELQVAIDQYPKSFPIPNNDLINTQSEIGSSDIAPPIWHNAGFIKKQITYDGNNSFNLKSYNTIFDANIFETTAFPFVSMSDSISKATCNFFSPNHFKFSISSEKKDTLKLMQMDFPLWVALIDGKTVKKVPGELIQVAVEPGKHEVELHFGSKTVYRLLYINFIIWGCFSAAIAYFSLSKRF
jgi:hypothetical protein